jgi:hypothetical protein
MNYVLYVIGTAAMVLGFAGGLEGALARLYKVAWVGTFDVGMQPAMLILSGIFICAYGSMIGLLNRIAQHTAKVEGQWQGGLVNSTPRRPV